MSACFHRIAATGRWVQSRVKKTLVEQSIIMRLRVAIVFSYQYMKYFAMSIACDMIKRSKEDFLLKPWDPDC